MNQDPLLKPYRELCQTLSLAPSFIEVVTRIYFPLAHMIWSHKKSAPLLVSINGAQGSGKSTLTRFVHEILEQQYHCQVASFSLDDFYYTREERERLARQVHPLLKTRGVPGTHDIDLLESVIKTLLSGHGCKIPVFDKAIDDQKPTSAWQEQASAADVILFEGWCNNSPVQNDEQLRDPINELEASEDADGMWRHYVNQKLKEYHKRVYDFAELTVFLKVPNFDQVFHWRKLQEDKLRASSQSSANRFMNDVELGRFLQHYERITRHTLACYSELANIVLPLDSSHRIIGIESSSPS